MSFVTGCIVRWAYLEHSIDPSQSSNVDESP